MRNLIHFEKGTTSYESALNFNKLNGFKSIVFASKIVDKEKAEELMQEYLLAVRTNLDQDLRLHKLAKSLEKDLDFEGIVGFENSLKDGAEDALKLFQSMGINIHILSGDNLEHCLMTAQTLDLIGNGKDTGYYHLEFTSEDIGRAQIKRILDLISQSVLQTSADRPRRMVSLQRQESDTEKMAQKLNIIINGDTIQIIQGNRYLTEHFKFILEFTKTIIGYDFCPENKAQLIRLFKSLDRVTAAFGDGYNDIPMLKSANIGIQVRSKLIPLKFGDILTDDLMPLAKLVSVHCRDWNENLNIVCKELLKLSLITILIEVFYQTHSKFTSASVFVSQLIVCLQLGVVPISLLFVFLEKKESEKARIEIPGLYCEKNYLTRELPIKSFLFRHVDLIY